MNAPVVLFVYNRMLSDKIEYYKKTKNTVAYIRQKDIDPIRHEELVLELLKKKGDVKRADVVDLLHVTEPQAFRILKKMADANKIRLVGSGAGSKYVLN